MSNSIFDLFDDHDRRQDRALDRIDQSITSAIENQAMSAQALFEQIRELYALDREQARELCELRATVKVMGQLLIELGIDESVLRYRVEAAVDESRAQAEEKAVRDRMISCAQCGQEVPPARTNITEFGSVCDRCAL